MDFEATEIFNLPKISRNTINKIVGKTRRMIFVVSQKAEKDYGEFELAKSYFGAKRIKGKRGRVATSMWIIKKRWQSLCLDSKKLYKRTVNAYHYKAKY